jgi:hypothetical protein
MYQPAQDYVSNKLKKKKRRLPFHFKVVLESSFNLYLKSYQFAPLRSRIALPIATAPLVQHHSVYFVFDKKSSADQFRLAELCLFLSF